MVGHCYAWHPMNLHRDKVNEAGLIRHTHIIGLIEHLRMQSTRWMSWWNHRAFSKHTSVARSRGCHTKISPCSNDKKNCIGLLFSSAQPQKAISVPLGHRRGRNIRLTERYAGRCSTTPLDPSRCHTLAYTSPWKNGLFLIFALLPNSVAKFSEGFKAAYEWYRIADAEIRSMRDYQYTDILNLESIDLKYESPPTKLSRSGSSVFRWTMGFKLGVEPICMCV